ncbi:hypothetical protein [uncultured Hoeflea sp.]|uniref:hypothetical protein n=1 Tax=uncultured Hoeflea sp. TaxID=538666 RepID=UPI00263243CA|nr:hypothetical protein [uncultured Hoeflea sp.]
MKMNYLSLKPVSKAEFDAEVVKLSVSEGSTLSTEEDVKKIENILDLPENFLKGEELLLSGAVCINCERTLSFYDFVFTALVENWHDSSFIVHTLIGSKHFLNSARPLRCSNCGSKKIQDKKSYLAHLQPDKDFPHDCMYYKNNYGCCKAST